MTIVWMPIDADQVKCAWFDGRIHHAAYFSIKALLPISEAAPPPTWKDIFGIVGKRRQ